MLDTPRGRRGDDPLNTGGCGEAGCRVVAWTQRRSMRWKWRSGGRGLGGSMLRIRNVRQRPEIYRAQYLMWFSSFEVDILTWAGPEGVCGVWKRFRVCRRQGSAVSFKPPTRYELYRYFGFLAIGPRDPAIPRQLRPRLPNLLQGTTKSIPANCRTVATKRGFIRPIILLGACPRWADQFVRPRITIGNGRTAT
jgi:hypothetical protein